MWVFNGCVSSVSFVRFNLYVRLVIHLKFASYSEQYSVLSQLASLGVY